MLPRPRIRVRLLTAPALSDPVAALAGPLGLTPWPSAGVGLLVTDGTDPAPADPWLVESLPHLVVALLPGQVRVGPFVDPGVTACLHCVAATEAEAPAPAPGGDSGARSGPGAGDDPAALAIALGAGARELAAWQDGRVPPSWSASLSWGPDLVVVRRRWLRHPHCGCSWGVAV